MFDTRKYDGEITKKTKKRSEGTIAVKPDLSGGFIRIAIKNNIKYILYFI